MSEATTVTLGNTDVTPGPTIEESHAALVKEGILTEGEEGGANTEITETPESVEEADTKASSSLEKFRREDGTLDTEALEKSYLELEKKMSKGETADDGESNDGDTEDNAENAREPAKEVSAEEQKQAADIAAKAQVDLAQASKDFLAKGELSAEDYAKFEAAGYPRAMIDTYANGLTTESANYAHAATEAAGGAENYSEMLEWAADNLEASEIAAYDSVIDGNNTAATQQAVKGLYARYQAANNDGTVEPSETIGGKAAQGGSVYNDQSEYMDDLNDPRYDKSEAFRSKVMAKLGRSAI